MADAPWQHGYARWLDGTALAGLGLLGLGFVSPLIAVALAPLFHLGALQTLWSLKTHRPTVADRVTLVRAWGVAALYPLGFFWGATWGLLALACLWASLDLIDGALARRFGATAFGAVFDMEMDQLMVTALALLGVLFTGLGPWLLLFPALRYIHLLLLRHRNLPRLDPKPKAGDNRRARLICALVVVVLLSNLLPLTIALEWRALANGLALALLVWSFADDFVFIATHQRLTPERPPS